MSKKLRIGIIGAGRIGKLHANNLVSRVKDAELVAISDVYEPAAKDLAEKLGVANYYSDYHKILEDPTIDAVFICSSTNTHSPISIEAAQAGKHIFCEKPIDHDLDKIKKVLDEVKKAGVKYQVGFQSPLRPQLQPCARRGEERRHRRRSDRQGYVPRPRGAAAFLRQGVRRYLRGYDDS